MRTRLIIPTEIQALIDLIESEEMVLSKKTLPDHPMFPNFTRHIEVYGVYPNLETRRTYLQYRQVGIEKTSGERVPLPLKVPEWLIGESEWSYLRHLPSFEKVMVTKEELKPVLDEAGNPTYDTEGKIVEQWVAVGQDTPTINTHKYMKFLMKQGVNFLALIDSYLPGFVEENIDKLNQMQ